MKAKIKSESTKFKPIVMEIVMESEQDVWNTLALFNQSTHAWEENAIRCHPVILEEDLPYNLFMLLDKEVVSRGMK